MLLVPLHAPRASIGPFGGSATLTAVDPANPSNVYAAAAEGGLYKSTDGGETWATADSGLGALWVLGIAIDPSGTSTMYLATGGGVYKSGDGAQSWSAINSGLQGNTNIRGIAVDPTDSNVLYAGAERAGTSGGVFKSVDGGASWFESSVGLTNRDVWTLALAPSDAQTLYVGTAFGSAPGLFKTSDGAQSWSPTSLSGQIRFVSIDPNDSNTVYAGTLGGLPRSYKSSDGGASWSELTRLPPYVSSSDLCGGLQHALRLFRKWRFQEHGCGRDVGR